MLSHDATHLMISIRLMRANEDLEVKTCGLQLHDKGSEKNKGCCGYGT